MSNTQDKPMKGTNMRKLSKKLYNWASIIEPNTEAQANLTSSMPFVQPHLALMPDAHLGKGATVGSVIPTIGAIMPAAVGVDIGCGMIAVRTQFFRYDLLDKDLSALRHSIERSIPLSAGAYNQKLTETASKRCADLADWAGSRVEFYDKLTRTNWQYHLGTLGSGNHFIEITLDEQDRVWLFLHSGSRGIGNAIAMHHIKVAQDLMKKWFIKLDDDDLAYLVEGTPEFDQYIFDLNWAQDFALMNREEMMDRVISDFEHWIGKSVEEQERINCHHNFTQKEHHMGRDVWLSRKGAIQADEGRPGLIPGSMGTASYVVVGKGCVPAFSSSPHGAGRVFSRGAAKKQFTLEDMDREMVGVEYNRSDKFLDEIPSAYKDIDQVMEDAKDLVEIKHTLHQIVNVKGD
jgi:tRNA-splicing ligase RtcB (3'-phosphate/5'-hydroxy nucleic acid ligase)